MQWHKKRKKEFYYRQAKKEKYRARSAYKLIELDKKFKLLHLGYVVVDLGAAPGSWSQVISERIGKNGFLLAVDVLPIAPLGKNFHFLKADIFKKNTIKKIQEILPRKADLVISDAAPEFSGIKSKDVGLANKLTKISFQIAKKILKKNGNFICKIFPSKEIQDFTREIKENFRVIKVIKPKSSLKKSSEMYLIAKNKF